MSEMRSAQKVLDYSVTPLLGNDERFPYQVEITEEERVREIDFGILDGLTKHGIAHYHPEEKERRSKLGKYHHRPPAGENYRRGVDLPQAA